MGHRIIEIKDNSVVIFIVQRVLPWPPNKHFRKLQSANHSGRFWLMDMPPPKVFRVLKNLSCAFFCVNNKFREKIKKKIQLKLSTFRCVVLVLRKSGTGAQIGVFYSYPATHCFFSFIATALTNY